jgi:hypothetical protein
MIRGVEKSEVEPTALLVPGMKGIVVPEGVEPSTLALLAPHSNQLSYGTLLWLTAPRLFAYLLELAR